MDLIKVLQEAKQNVPAELGALANEGGSGSYGGSNRYTRGFGGGSNYSGRTTFENRGGYGNARYWIEKVFPGLFIVVLPIRT